jgi:murein hydrolase activator
MMLSSLLSSLSVLMTMALTPTSASMTLQELTKELRELDNADAHALEVLAALEEAIWQAKRDQHALQWATDDANSRLQLLQEQLRRDDDEATRVEQQVQQRLRTLYVSEHTDAWWLWWQADSFTDVVLRARMWRMLAVNDAGLWQAWQRLQQTRKERSAALERSLTEHHEQLAQLQAHQEILEAARAERAASLQRLRIDKLAAAKQRAQLVQQEAALRALLPAPSTDVPQAPAFRAGSLPWPVDGLVTRGFGVSVTEGDAEVMNNGVSLRADAGVAVTAPAAGRVAHVGSMRGLGQVVIVDHRNGFHSLLAHMARIDVTVGTEVEAGTRLGASSPDMYFELRRRGRPVDPQRYLRLGR